MERKQKGGHGRIGKKERADFLRSIGKRVHGKGRKKEQADFF
jgi:hypothetical protein